MNFHKGVLTGGREDTIGGGELDSTGEVLLGGEGLESLKVAPLVAGETPHQRQIGWSSFAANICG